MSIIKKAREESIWIFNINTGGCNGCDMELFSTISSRYDIEQFGIKFVPSPRQADIIIISGTITTQSRERMLRVLSQVPEPKVIIALGICPKNGGVFKGSYSLDEPLDKWTKVDLYIPGCPPSPEMIVKGILEAVQILKHRSEEDYYA